MRGKKGIGMFVGPHAFRKRKKNKKEGCELSKKV